MFEVPASTVFLEIAPQLDRAKFGVTWPSPYGHSVIPPRQRFHKKREGVLNLMQLDNRKPYESEAQMYSSAHRHIIDIANSDLLLRIRCIMLLHPLTKLADLRALPKHFNRSRRYTVRMTGKVTKNMTYNFNR